MRRRMAPDGPRRTLAAVLGATLLGSVGCAAGAPSATPAPPGPAPTVAASPSTAAITGAGVAAPSAAGRPEVPTTPLVTVKVGTVPLAHNSAYFIARERGYFKEVGLEAELQDTGTNNDQRPLLRQGQLHAGSALSQVAFFNALARDLDLRIVADFSSAGKTEKSRGGGSLVARKDRWEAGTIRQAKDLAGRTVALAGGAGSPSRAEIERWLRRHDVDSSTVDWITMFFPDQVLAMQSGGVELGFQTELLLSLGLTRGYWQVLATLEEMNPNSQSVFAIYTGEMDKLGPLVGERFMVALLRGVRAHVNGFEYGVDQDQIIDILTRETVIKDPAVYRQIRYNWMDPNGVVQRASVEAYEQFFAENGFLQGRPDLSRVFDERYRQFAVQHLGEYQPPALRGSMQTCCALMAHNKFAGYC